MWGYILCVCVCADYLRSMSCKADQYYDDVVHNCEHCSELCDDHIVKKTTNECFNKCRGQCHQPFWSSSLPHLRDQPPYPSPPPVTTGLQMSLLLCTRLDTGIFSDKIKWRSHKLQTVDSSTFAMSDGADYVVYSLLSLFPRQFPNYTLMICIRGWWGEMRG